MPPSYSIHDMGMHDYGGGSRKYHGPIRSVANLVGPNGTPDVSYTFTAAYQRANVAGHRQRVYTVNGSSPGPTVFAEQGDLVRVVLRNRNVAAGTTIHWHGMDIPNGEDGVAGVTQNAVLPGKQFVYRFRATNAGTYWYHSHQYAQQQVTQGLVGAVVVQPRDLQRQGLTSPHWCTATEGATPSTGKPASRRSVVKWLTGGSASSTPTRARCACPQALRTR